MVGARNLDLRRALESPEHIGARFSLFQHLRKVALAVNVEHRHSQFTGLGKLAAADTDGDPDIDPVVGRADEKEIAHARAHAVGGKRDLAMALALKKRERSLQSF